MVDIFAEYLDEPNCIFGKENEEKDPKLGLKYFGPYYSKSEKKPIARIDVGVVGDSHTITFTKRILKILENPIKNLEENRWLYPNYPGFKLDSEIGCEFRNSDRLNAEINFLDLNRLKNISDVNIRIATAVNIFIEKIQNILMDEKPNVIICALPYLVEEYCGVSEYTYAAKKRKLTELEKKIEDLKSKGQTFLSNWIVEVEEEKELGYDFRNMLKGRILQVGIPIQIIRETVLRGILEYPSKQFSTNQSPTPFAWNLSTALYYKALGKPWRLAKLSKGSCYVGVSFFKSRLKLEKNLQVSMAQVFLDSGEGFVLRGGEVEVDRDTNEPRLKKLQAYSLLNDALEKYEKKVGTKPVRVVVHKTSKFTQEEMMGFNDAIGNAKRDFISLSTQNNIRFLRTGQYPVLRGTIISLSKNECLLYTSGYSPRIRTYPAHRIPVPLYIIHNGDSEITFICSEILGLTKLNWNTTSFSTQMPITLHFAKEVGKVLSELPDTIDLQDHYKYYM
jgi:hypothetical protein